MGLVGLGVMAAILGAVGAEDVPRYVTERQREAMGCGAHSVAAHGSPTGGHWLPAMERRCAGVWSATTSGSLGVSASLAADGATASRIAEMILRLEPGTDRELVYEIAQSIARRSRNAGIRAELLCAVIANESRFDPNARSRTGDHGLCQLHGRPIYGIDENIKAGAAHLAGAIRTQGSEERGLAAYNGGPRGPGMGVCRAYARDVLGKAGAASGAPTGHGGGEF